MIRAESATAGIPDGRGEAPSRARPPVGLLVLGLGAVVVSGATVGSRGLAGHGAGYVLGSVVTIGCVGLFHRIDRQRRQQPLYEPHRFLTRYAGLVVALGIVVAAMHTWWIATELAK